MSGLPQGWASIHFEEVVDHDAPIIYGILQPGPEHPDGVKYVRPTEIQDGSIDLSSIRSTSREIADKYKRSRLKEGDVLLSIVGTIGKVALVPKELEGGNITQSSCRMRPDRALTTEKFLQRFLMAPQAVEQYDKKRMGTAVPRLNLADVREFQFPLPPLPEQRRIVRKLDTLSACTSTARNHLANIEKLVERYKEAALTAVLINAEQGNSNWQSATLEKIRDPKASIRYGVVQPGIVKDQGVTLVRVCDMIGGVINWTDLRRVSPEIDAAYANARIENGDVLVSVVGTIGRVALVKGLTEKTNIARAVSRIRPNSKCVDPSWLFWRLNARDVQARFNGDVREVARKTLNIGLLKETPFKLPPLGEQREIVRRIETAFAKIDRLAAEAAKALKLTDRLDQRILAKAFAGELVPQDPNDEPAAKLLERIRTARLAESQLGGRRRGRRRNIA